MNPFAVIRLSIVANIAMQSGAGYAHWGNSVVFALSDPKIDPRDPKIYMHFALP